MPCKSMGSCERKKTYVGGWPSSAVGPLPSLQSEDSCRGGYQIETARRRLGSFARAGRAARPPAGGPRPVRSFGRGSGRPSVAPLGEEAAVLGHLQLVFPPRGVPILDLVDGAPGFHVLVDLLDGAVGHVVLDRLAGRVGHLIERNLVVGPRRRGKQNRGQNRPDAPHRMPPSPQRYAPLPTESMRGRRPACKPLSIQARRRPRASSAARAVVRSIGRPRRSDALPPILERRDSRRA